MRYLLAKLKRSERGAAAVEMAICTPFLLVIGFGAIEFGNIFYDYQAITTGMRDAARYLARFDDPYAVPGDTDCEPYAAATISNAKKIAVYGQITGTRKRVSWWDETNASHIDVTVRGVSNNDGLGLPLYRGSEQICFVTVKTNVMHPSLGFLGLAGLGGLVRIRTHHEERIVGD